MLSDEYVNRMKEKFGADACDFLKSYEKPSYRALRVNTLKGSTEEFLRKNPWGIKEKDAVKWCREGFYFDNPDINGKHPYHAAGVFYIQEPSAMLPVTLLDIKEGDRVLDLCAAPGGKSTQIAAALNKTGYLISNEPVKARAKILSENTERIGAGNVMVISHTPGELEERFLECFDKILVDAPCSGEGMFRKNPDAVSEWSTENVNMCAERQRSILSSAYKMLKKGGRLVYSTCTFESVENEANAEWFDKSFEDIHILNESYLLPHEVKGEGHYCALFERDGEPYENAPAAGYESGLKEKDIREYRRFEKEYLNVSEDILFNEGRYIRFGNELYLSNRNFPDMRGLTVLRAGLHLGTLKDKYFLPSHSLALYLNEEGFQNTFALETGSAVRYLKGETICDTEQKREGFVLLCCDGYSIGFGKINNGMIKNHYPKGLRIL